MAEAPTPSKASLHSSGKTLDVYDGLFTVYEQKELYSFIKKSLYKLDGFDDYAMPLEMQLYSGYSLDDLAAMGFADKPQIRALFDKYGLSAETHELRQVRVNLTTPSERNRRHTDGNGVTILYYANLEWELEWGGHTLFLDDTLDEVDCVCAYKPGRVIVFDGRIPHMIITPSPLCPTYRVSFALQFERKEDN